MAGDAFNGSVATWPNASTTLGPLRSIEYSESGAKIDVSGSSSANHFYAAGLPDRSVTITIVGGLGTISVGDAGALGVTWNDADTAGTMAAGVVVEANTSGDMDGEMTSTMTIVPTA